MAEYNKQRFYWIKLTDRFMTSDTVDFLMEQKDGANYVVIYQMLCLKTVNNDGCLSRSIGEMIIPYDEEKIQRDLKNQNFVDNYFENIDTEEKAYFLGLIYSDGNVREHNGGYFLNLELKREDRYILEKLASEFKCGNKIYDRNRKTNFGESCTSSFTTCNSKKMFDDLSKFNIVPNKSHTTESFCDNIEELIPFHLIKHFLRGLIDGDGTISKRYTTNQNAISIYQNEIQFCYDFNRLLKIAIDDENLHENIIINKVSGVYNLRYRRINDVCKICNFLYKDATIYLKRKYNLAKLYFENNQENQQSDSLLLCSNE